MAKYIGKRIVPVHCGRWNQNKTYEMLSIVLEETSGDSYISRRAVPSGTAITDTNYWMLHSLYSQQIKDMSDQLTAAEQRIKADNDQTEAAIRQDNDATEAAIRQDNQQTREHVDSSLEQTTETLTETVNSARSAMTQQKASFDQTATALNTRMDAVLAAGTGAGETEILDARVDMDGTEYDTLGSAIRGSANKLKNAFSYELYPEWYPGYIGQEGGISSQSETQMEVYSDMISSIRHLDGTLTIPEEKNFWFAIATYNEDGVFTERTVVMSGNAVTKSFSYDVPESASFIRISFRTFGLEYTLRLSCVINETEQNRKISELVESVSDLENDVAAVPEMFKAGADYIDLDSCELLAELAYSGTTMNNEKLKLTPFPAGNLYVVDMNGIEAEHLQLLNWSSELGRYENMHYRLYPDNRRIAYFYTLYNYEGIMFRRSSDSSGTDGFIRIYRANWKSGELYSYMHLAGLYSYSGQLPLEYVPGQWARNGAIKSGGRMRSAQLYKVCGRFKASLKDYETYRFAINKYAGPEKIFVDTGWLTSDLEFIVAPDETFGISFSKLDNSDITEQEDAEAMGFKLEALDVYYKHIAYQEDVDALQDSLGTLSSDLNSTVVRFEEASEEMEKKNTDYDTRASMGFNTWRFEPYYDHIFIDKIYGSAIIPSESLFNIQISHRLGFKMIEANVHKLADGNYIVMHGASGKFGKQVVHVDGETDVSQIDIASVTLDWVKENLRYVSDYPKYRVAPSTLQEYLYECRKCLMIPFMQFRDTEQLDIANEIMGKDNYVIYGGGMVARNYSSAPCMIWGNLATKEEIVEWSRKMLPSAYSMAHPENFTDEELAEIVNEVHAIGGWIGMASSYLSESDSQRLWALGFDYSASGWAINDFQIGNLCNLTADANFDDFVTDGTEADGVLALEEGQTITQDKVTDSQFLAGANLHIRFDGKIKVNMGDYIRDGRNEVESDGTHSMWFSTYFMNQVPTFTITALEETRVLSMTYKASKL